MFIKRFGFPAVSLAPEGGGSGAAEGDKGGGGGGAGATPPPPPIDTKALSASLAHALATSLTRTQMAQREAEAAEAARAAEEKALAEADKKMDEMKPAELGSHIFKRIVKEIDDKVVPKFKELDTKLTGSQREQARERYAADVRAAMSDPKMPHFAQFQEEMIGLLRDHPDLSPKQLYALATTQNEEKFSKLENTRREALAAEEAEKRPKFGGLLPTSGAASVKTSNMTPTAAAEAAFNEVFGNSQLGRFFGE